MLGLLGKKIGMLRIFTDERELPVTILELGPCYILQIKTEEKDGYNSLKLGFSDVKQNRISQPLRGEFEKLGIAPKRFIREIRLETPIDKEARENKYRIGKELRIEDIFSVDDFVDITGTSIGCGFQGGVKRWHWKGGPKTHGSMSHRAPGSIGASSDPSRVYKGQHLPGRMGAKRVTIQNLKIVDIDKENNLVLVKGAVPGHKNSFLIVRKAKKKAKK